MRRRSAAIAASVGMAASMTAGVNVATAPPAAAQPTSFQCTTDGILTQSGDMPDPSTMYLVDMASGEVTEGPQLLEHVNAIGYNIQDDLVYGVDRVNGNLIRFGANGEMEVVASAADVLDGTTNVVGDVDDVDHYWHFDFTTGTWYQVDLNSTTADAAVQVDSGTVTWPSFGTGAGDDYRAVLDWTYVDGTDSLYAIANTPDRNESHLLRFDRTTKEFELVANLGDLGDINQFGATYTDASGYLYIGNNQTGVIYRVDPETGETLEFSEGPETSQNDGARCMNAPVPIDYGDAPESYGTLLEDEGARHSIPGYAVDETAPLMLGSNISIDTDGAPGPAADGDTHDDGVADPIVLDWNQPTTVSVTATNETNEPATLAGWIDLDGSGTFDAGELVTVDVPAGSGTATYDLEFPAAMLSDDTYARFRLFGDEVMDPSPVDNAAGGEVEDYLVSARSLDVEKSSDATEDSRAGDTVTYSVTATNTGTGDFTADDPAVLVDDLSGVLDDATLDEGSLSSNVGDAPTYTEPRVAWSGPLGVDESVTVTYEVTLTGDGDGNVRNVAFGSPCDPADPECEPVTPECDPPNEDGLDPDTGLPCAEEEFDLPRLSIVKEADTAELPAVGETATYTVTVTNEGPGDYTESAPAEMTDDLTEVLDDATLDEGSLSSTVGDAPTFEDPDVMWSGALGAGESTEIEYTVTYTGEGDQLLENLACVPEPDTHPDAEPCDIVEIPGSLLEQSKSVDPESGTPVSVGDELTYTLTFTNDGQAAADVDTFDDVSGVLDDADLVDGPTSSSGDLMPVLEGEQITIAGSVAAGESVTVSYTVQVLPFFEQGDNVLQNLLADCEPDDPECSTQNPVQQLQVEKSSDATEDSRAGDTVTYSVTATNIGEADYTAENPASLMDDLTGVLDDATLDEGSLSSNVGDAPTYTEPQVTWSGPLGVDESVTVTYEVTLTGDGDGNVRNVAFTPPCDPADPECEPVTPECDPPNEDGLDPDTGLPCAEEEFDLPRLIIEKEADTAELPAVGETATYTVTVTNVGPGVYTEDAPAEFSDDLSGVLDDATLDEGSMSSTVGDAPTFEDPEVTWSGALGADESTEISYTVTYTGEGDQLLENLACVPEPDTHPDAEPCDTVQIPGAYIVDWKSVEASGDPVEAGTVLTYTLTFTNEGQAAGDVDKVDDLTHVLDDGDVTAGPTSSDEDALVASEITDDQFTITGSLEPGETVTVTYEVTLRPDGERNDNIASNFLLPPGENPPPDPECVPEDDEQPDCTTTPIGEVVPSKSADPESGTTVVAGDVVTYTLTFENIGEGSGTVDYEDVLDGVLDDAELTGDPTASSDALSVTGPEDGRIAVTGTLDGGQTETVTYEVTVDPDGERGDDVLGNFVVDPGEDPEEECLEDDPLCTQHPVPEILDHKSVDPASGTPVTEDAELTYTLTFTNDGAATGEVDRVDDLTHIVDDAELVAGPVSSDEALEASGPDDANRIAITGELEPGQTVTVTYTVVVRDAEDRGDDILANFLLDREEDPPSEPECDPDDPDCTSNPVGNIVAEKSVDPESGTEVAPGDELTYTISFENVGEGADEVDFTDHVADVADDASLLSGPEASDDALSVSDVEDGAFAVTGTLEAGQAVTVTYTVSVREYDEQGDGHLANFVTPTGEDPPSECVDSNPLCTENPVEPPPDEQPPPEDDLPDTGAGADALLVLAGAGLMFAGLMLAGATSRRSRSGQAA